KDKGKAIQPSTCIEGVDSANFFLLRGGCSVGPGGPNNCLVDQEFCFVNRLKDKELAFLAWQESKSAPPCVFGDVQNSVSLCRSNRKELEGRKKPVVPLGGFTRCERFVQAVRGGKGARRGRKKGRTVVPDSGNGEHEDSISNDSLGLNRGTMGRIRTTVPISSLQVILSEGEHNRIHDAESAAYRIEAERLFNIGLNLGCSSNEERITMIERLIDLEVKEGVSVVDLGDVDVDQ
ncbi:hypothetical protein A2U01_0006035, partial [Trifolium medium]|nr:hypothetical protein [Trifolium medium]